MSGVKQQIADLQSRFIGLSQRERWLVLGASWALLAWVGLLIYESSLQASIEQQEQAQQSLERQINEQTQLSAELELAIAKLSNNGQEQQLARLNQRLSRLNENVDERMRTLVEPDQMSSLLLTMLEKSDGLTLLELGNQPPELLNANAMAEAANSSNTASYSQALYRHNLSLQLSGSYMALLDYVQQLEQLSGRIFWQGLEFEVEEYPQAIIRLNFFTISQHKELLRG
ncbi:MSHA biogenesis protein MshJ [Oceanisphaera pacifica]|uniref:MSHA biogenesis protein MshJ n=1 Tax=Oceanisphaera pacifica TaxID=2818389 RepID=A0ABS3NDT6_9GAMM|nr:MSHA biogenesis protein MshJ [Oceanisphaera pacifica]MBO1518758.1 MSHA biogenesis protein MshJ [Oceanisphaera pacifica]